jgi:hypothetical protein
VARVYFVAGQSCINPGYYETIARVAMWKTA